MRVLYSYNGKGTSHRQSGDFARMLRNKGLAATQDYCRSMGYQFAYDPARKIVEIAKGEYRCKILANRYV